MYATINLPSPSAGRFLSPSRVTRPRSRQLPNLSFFQGSLPKEPRKSFGDYLSKTSMTIHMALNLLLWASPEIARRRLAVKPTAMLLSRLGVNASQKARWIQRLTDPLALKLFLQKGISGANLFQLNTGWQLGINTQQPSKSIASLVAATSEIMMIGKTVAFWQKLKFISGLFWYVGETNDIRNNVDPAHRREWDLRRIGRLLLGRGETDWKGECASLAKFILGDCHYAFSFGPWRDLHESVRTQADWRLPQSYQTALGAQFSLIAFLAGITPALTSRIGKRLSPAISGSAFSTACGKFSKFATLCSMIAYLPVTMRALQNWKDKESLLTLAGMPLVTMDRIALTSGKIETWKGLCSLGLPMVNEGKRMNSKRYRTQIDYIRFLSRLSEQNPQLTAGDVLKFLTAHPEERLAMEKHMGKIRVDYLLKKLEEGELEQNQRHISFRRYLAPMMEGNQAG